MVPKNMLQSLKSAVKYAFVHMMVTAVFWMMYFALPLNLGFKDKEEWTFINHALLAIVPPVATVLTTPGRLFVWDGGGGILIPALLTSATWGVALSVGFAILKR